MSLTVTPTQTASASDTAANDGTPSNNGVSSHNGKAPTTATARRKSTGVNKTTNQDTGKPKANGKTNWQIVWSAVEHIAPNPFQPRLSFDQLEMQELTASVRATGVQQPIIVRTAKPALPAVEGLFGDSDLANQLLDRHPRLGLAQDMCDLPVGLQ